MITRKQTTCNILRTQTLEHKNKTFLPSEQDRSMAESSGEHAPRWYDNLEPRRHMIAERSKEKLNLHGLHAYAATHSNIQTDTFNHLREDL